MTNRPLQGWSRCTASQKKPGRSTRKMSDALYDSESDAGPSSASSSSYMTLVKCWEYSLISLPPQTWLFLEPLHRAESMGFMLARDPSGGPALKEQRWGLGHQVWMFQTKMEFQGSTGPKGVSERTLGTTPNGTTSKGRRTSSISFKPAWSASSISALITCSLFSLHLLLDNIPDRVFWRIRWCWQSPEHSIRCVG